MLDPDEYPGWINLAWGLYTNIAWNIHPHVFTIQINYEVFADSTSNNLDGSHDLQLWALADNGAMQYTTVVVNPIDNYHYESTWTITSGLVFDRVKAGGYIKAMAIQMYCNEPNLTYTWLNVDYVDTFYWYHMFNVDFYYDLDFSGYSLGSITQFDVNVDLDETVSLTGLHLWDYTTESWDFIDFVGTTGTKKFTITSEADHYFNAIDHMRVRFARSKYFDGRPYTDYQIKVDLLRIDIPPPDPLLNVQVNQGIKHILLTWDVAHSYGAPITHYNVYHGITPGGSKTLIGTPTSPAFNDTDAGIPINLGTEFYYVISATSTLGEGDNSTEVHGRAYDLPFVEWSSPAEGATVIFPYNETDIYFEWVMFDFTYDWTELDDVTLKIEGTDFGSVWGKNSIRLNPYTVSLDGPVTANLTGYKEGAIVAYDTRDFIFARTLSQEVQMLDFGQETLGQQLYLILHDPNGDESYSGFNETTILSIGVGHEITTLGAEDIELGISMDLFNLGVGGSTLITENETEEVGFDFRFEVSDPTSLTSNQGSLDPAFIGPGYGDMYWGETWLFNWVLNATWREFSYGGNKYEEPEIYYGIIRETESFVSDANAPPNWRVQNPVYNSYADVLWHDLLYCDEDKVYTENYLVSNTLNRTQSFQFQIDPSAASSLGIGTQLNITETKRNYAETALAHTYETSYHIYDNEPGDWIVQEVGIDTRFGTYIFNTSSLCQTSKPYEHNTNDYIAPVFENPVIVYDSNGDLQGPCYDDSPIVSVELFDEGVIQEVILMYSTNNGTSWDSVVLSEKVGNPGTWEGAIPAQPENTTVTWYLVARDSYNNNQTRKDLNTGLPFTYNVSKKFEEPPETPEEPFIPGYSLTFILPITIVTIMAIIIIYRKKH